MTLDEAISHSREKAEELKKDADYLDAPCGMDTSARTDCLECSKEHEQLADWLEELKERREKDRWISVGEALPDKDEFCLVVVKYEARFEKGSPFETIQLLAFYEAKYKRFNISDKVIAWRPLPEPYKESEDE